MKNIFFIFLLLIFCSSCSPYKESKNLNIENAQLAHSKFSNLENEFSYDEYKSLIVEYGKNSKFPDLK